jgi:hypothetical protein
MTLERRTPLRRGKPLRSGGGLKRGGSLRRTGRLNPISRKRADELEQRARVRQAVYERDRGCLLRGMPDAGRCAGRPTPHHVRKEGQGGPYTLLNLVQLCAGHNDWIETAQGQPLAHAWGLWCRRGEDLENCWRLMQAAGLVSHLWNGDPAP